MHTPIPTHLAKSSHIGTPAALSINKIVVVGHPLSGYEGVENLLNNCGMRPAGASLREGLSAAQVGATLLKAHRVIPLDALQAHGRIQSLQPGPIWQSLALDLMLGNLNHDLWGWSDPQAVYLLDYWKNLDPQLAFMLVYDTPQDLIARAFDNPDVACTPEILQTALRNWEAYNEALLQFYHRNPQRCMLVHAAQVRARAADYLHQVQTRIGAPLTPAPDQGTDASTLPSTALAEATNEACAAPADPHYALRTYAAQALLTQQPLVMQRYEELQASASLPLADQNQGPSSDPALRALQAVVALQKQQTQQQALHHQTLAALEAEKVDIAARLSVQIEEEKATHQSTVVTSQQENTLLLTQLHYVQEELERHFLESKNRQEKLDSLTHEKTQTERLVAEREQQIDQLKQAAEERSAQMEWLTQAKAAADKLVAERQQKIEQLKQAAEERSAQIERLTQAKAAADKLVAERQQKIEQLKQAVEERSAQMERLKQAAEQARIAQAKKLAPASAELQQENDLLLAQLHQVQEELERYYLENQRLKAKPSAPVKPTQPPAPYGAAERVKQQLGYQLGLTLIERSRSLGGWLGMPFALIGVARQYKRELPQRKAAQQVPIEKYRDAYEAEGVKQHLSYRLGAELIKHGKNPLHWLALPFSLQKARKDWLSQKTQ